MNYRMIARTVGYVLLAEAMLLLLPVAVAVYMHEAVLPFVITQAATAVPGLLLSLIPVRSRVLYARDGFLIVSLSWILVSVLGALPFVIGGSIPSYVDALFETVSGFTTTGSSILAEVESLPRSILFWRSFTHWIGGMGVLVFIMAILPLANERSMHVMRAECPGPEVGKIVPRARNAALYLYGVYFALTVAEMIALRCGGMPWFDCVVNAFGTAGTGGFSILNGGIGAYNSLYAEIVITVFMLLFGINFNVYFFLLARTFKPIFKMEELRVYLITAVSAMLLIGWNILPIVGSIGSSVRYSTFQVAAMMTSTGFSTADFNAWPTFSKCIMFLLMLMGACGGSTGGGMKVSRIIILVKKTRADLMRLLHPRSVRVVRLDGRRLDDGTVNAVALYFIVYLLIMMVSTLLLSLSGCDLDTALTASVTTLSNIGPGFSAIGPTANFAFFPVPCKLLLSLLMLMGRLEIFPLLLTLSPSMYRRR